jgi:hypothetical protein
MAIWELGKKSFTTNKGLIGEEPLAKAQRRKGVVCKRLVFNLSFLRYESKKSMMKTSD